MNWARFIAVTNSQMSGNVFLEALICCQERLRDLDASDHFLILGKEMCCRVSHSFEWWSLFSLVRLCICSVHFQLCTVHNLWNEGCWSLRCGGICHGEEILLKQEVFAVVWIQEAHFHLVRESLIEKYAVWLAKQCNFHCSTTNIWQGILWIFQKMLEMGTYYRPCMRMPTTWGKKWRRPLSWWGRRGWVKGGLVCDWCV